MTQAVGGPVPRSGQDLGRSVRAWLPEALRSTFSGDGSALFAATAAVNIFGFAVHVVVSRGLSAPNYGGYAALLGLLLMLAAPGNALQAAVAQRVAASRKAAVLDRRGPVPIALKPLLVTAVVFGAAALSILLPAAPFVASFLRLESLRPALLLAAWAVAAAIGLIPRAILLGELRYRRVAAALVAGAFVRLVLTVALTRSGGVAGAMAAIVAGEVVSVLVLAAGLRELVALRVESPSVEVDLADIVRPMAAITGYWTFTAVDTWLARHLYTGTASGHYAAAAVTARAAMFLPAALAVIAFPTFARTAAAGTKARAALFHTLAITAAVSLSIVGAVLVLASQLVTVVFGRGYLDAVPPLRVLVVGSACLGAFNVLMYYAIAGRRGLLAGFGWVGCGAVAAIAAATHPGPTALATLTSIVAAAMLAVLLGIVVIGRAPSEGVAADLRDRELLGVKDPVVEVSIVIPYFNPGPNLSANVAEVLRELERSTSTYEVIAVSDGSTDGSAEILAELSHPHLVHLVLSTNQGKGSALRTGLSRSSGRYIGFIDADGDIDTRALAEFLRLVELYEPDVVLGSKRHPMSSVKYPPIRRLYSWVYQQLVRVLFHLNIRDSQTGIKLVRREVLAAVLPRMVEKRFAFDLELFVVARHLGYEKFFEAPVQISHQFRSTVSRRAVWGMLVDTLAIFYRLRCLRYYDRPAEGPAKRKVADRH